MYNPSNICPRSQRLPEGIVTKSSGGRIVAMEALYLDVREIAGEFLARLLKIDAGTGLVLISSVLNAIRNRKLE